MICEIILTIIAIPMAIIVGGALLILLDMRGEK